MAGKEGGLDGQSGWAQKEAPRMQTAGRMWATEHGGVEDDAGSGVKRWRGECEGAVQTEAAGARREEQSSGEMMDEAEERGMIG
jgi:hypothetical protein